MAGVARGGESSRLVIRIVGIVVIVHVARAAGITVELVIAVYVALQAGQLEVRPGKRKARGGMIELATAPGICVMTVLASGRKARLLVVGIGRVLIVLQVAGHTRCVGDVIVAVDVAL